MTVKSKSVTNRRQVSYQSFDDLLADAETLAGQEVQTLGNWSLAQILEHLAISLEGSIDGLNFKAPWPLRVVGKMFLLTSVLLMSRGRPMKARISLANSRARAHLSRSPH